MSEGNDQTTVQDGAEGAEVERVEESTASTTEGQQSAPEAASAKPAETPANPYAGWVPMARVSEITRQKRELENRIAELERAHAGRQGQGAQGGQQEGDDAFPDPYNYPTREAFNAAVKEYHKNVESKVEQRIRERLEQEGGASRHQIEAQRYQERVIGQFDAGFSELAKEDKTVEQALPIFAEMRHLNPQIWWGVAGHKEGARIAVEMARDPNFADALLSSNQFQAGQLIAEKLIEIKQRAPKPPVKPTKTVGGSGAAGESLSPDLDEATWFANRSKSSR